MNAQRGRVPVGLVIVLAFIAIVAAIGGGAWWWWERNGEAMKEAAIALYAEGQAAGAKLGESGCLDGALDRHGDKDNQSLLGVVRTTVFLQACLDSAKPDPAFCANVPAKGEILAVGAWTAKRCADRGYTDQYCPNVLNVIPDHCSSKRGPA